MSKILKRHSPIRWAAVPALLTVCGLASLPAAAQDCEVKIGAAGPMTGGGASWGLATKAGTEFEAAWTNANGGVPMGNRKCKVTVVAVDAMSTAAGGAAAANYLASQNVHAVIGPPLSVESTGFKPVGKRDDIVHFTTAFASDALGPEFPLVFHQLQAPPAWAELVIKTAKDRFKLKSVVVVGPNDQGGTDSGNQLAKYYNANDIKANTEWYQRGQTNLAPIATRIMNLNVDTVEMGPMPPGEGAILAKQLLEAGFTGTFGRLGAGGDVIIKNAGGIAAFKKFYWFDHMPTQSAAIKQFNADFERMMKAPIPDNALVYNAQISAENVLKAISRAGTDQSGEKIAAELRKMVPESRYLGKAGWRGKAQYGINQEFSFPVGFNYIQDGKLGPQMKIDIPAEN
jgi:branched-chain amino acid transport system substrate-binding protein